jgi:intracellular septation protein
MGDADLEALRADPAARRGAELKAFLFAVRPIASDLAATLVFYLVLIVGGRVEVAVALGIALGLGQLVWALARRVRIAPMQWVSLVLVVVMGGATLVTHDPRFVLIKVSVVYALIGGAMLQPGWLHRYIPPIAVRHIPERWVVISGYVWAGLILGTGVLNLILTLTVEARTVAGVMTVWAIGSKIALFAGQYALFRLVARRSIRAALSASTGPDAGTG